MKVFFTRSQQCLDSFPFKSTRHSFFGPLEFVDTLGEECSGIYRGVMVVAPTVAHLYFVMSKQLPEPDVGRASSTNRIAIDDQTLLFTTTLANVLDRPVVLTWPSCAIAFTCFSCRKWLMDVLLVIVQVSRVLLRSPQPLICDPLHTPKLSELLGSELGNKWMLCALVSWDGMGLNRLERIEGWVVRQNVPKRQMS